MIKAIGVGDNVVDKYIHKQIMYPGGNALNFSVYAKMLGAEAAYIGTFGNDSAAAHIVSVLKEMEIDVSRCRHVDGENGFARVNLVDGDRVFLAGNNGGVQKEHPIVLSDLDMQYIRSFDIVHTSCYSYNMENEIGRIKEAGVPVSYDFSNHFDEVRMEKICPNVDFSFFSCSHLSDSEIRELLLAAHLLSGGMALGTAGARGAMLYDGMDYYFQGPDLVQAIDTLGAGDSFITAFVLNYMARRGDAGQSKAKILRDSLKKGAAFAARNCMVCGAFGYGLNY